MEATLIIITVIDHSSAITTLKLIRETIIEALGKLHYMQESDNILNGIKYGKILTQDEKRKLNDYITSEISVPQWNLFFIEIDDEITATDGNCLSAKEINVLS